jgi:hypothetical protein
MPRKAAPLSAGLDGDERAEQDHGRPEQPEHLAGTPARGVGADDGADERQQPRRAQHGAAEVEPAGSGTAALCDEDRRGDQCDGGHRDVDEEDPLPAERVDEHAAGDDAERPADARQRAPDAERDVALVSRGERDGEQRERRGGEQRGADALDRADGDQRFGGAGEAARE